MHNGAFTRLDDALRYHLNVLAAGPHYDPLQAGIEGDLLGNVGPLQPVLDRLDPALRSPAPLSEQDIQALVIFLRDGLTDERDQAGESGKAHSSIGSERPSPANISRSLASALAGAIFWTRQDERQPRNLLVEATRGDDGPTDDCTKSHDLRFASVC
jgi:hypothetical protein